MALCNWIKGVSCDKFLYIQYIVYILVTFGFFLVNPNKTKRELLAVLGQSVHFSHFRLFSFFKILVVSSTLPKRG